MRFVALQEPNDNWMVYDLLLQVPAEFAGQVLYGLSRQEAELLANQGNAAFTFGKKPQIFDQPAIAGRPNAAATLPATAKAPSPVSLYRSSARHQRRVGFSGRRLNA
jgi:hypothetical protein